MRLTKLIVKLEDHVAGRAAAERIELAATLEPQAVTAFEDVQSGGWRIEAYYERAPDLQAVAQALGPPVTPDAMRLETVPDANWVAISQAALPPVTAGRFQVHGSHDRARIGRRLTAIEIDAGEAFGTAHHATTQGCLIALDRLTRRRAFGQVLDLGCGSGVLAIAAARVLPEARIWASDSDPQAVRVARANVADNRLGRRIEVIAANGFQHRALRHAQPFDLLLANILAAPLIDMAPKIARAVALKGAVVLSGILAGQAPAVEATYRSTGFAIADKRIANGWATLVLERRGPAARRPITCARRAV